MSVRFWVTLIYVEPTYARHADRSAVRRRWTLEVEAQAPEQAVEQAIDRFHQLFALSSVGWVREVVAYDVVQARITRDGGEA